MTLRIYLVLLTWFFVAAVEISAAQITEAVPADIVDDPFVREGLASEARFDSKAALSAFQRADVAHPNNAYLQQKISRQFSDLTADTSDSTEKKRLCEQALIFGRRAVELQPASAVNQLSLGICYGKLGLYSDLRTRIEYSRFVRQYAERALELNPDYDYAHHVLGRWHYEVASLGVGARFLVKLIYGGLPPASTAEAVRHLQRAVALSPTLPAHQIELGLALLADGQRDAARTTLEHALTMPTKEKHDVESRARATEALKKLR